MRDSECILSVLTSKSQQKEGRYLDSLKKEEVEEEIKRGPASFR